MAQLNFKKIAQEIAKKESSKKEVDIAQISEVLKITFELLAQYPLLDLSNFLDKYR